MERKDAIKSRKDDKPTNYFPAGRMINLPGIGEFPDSLRRIRMENIKDTLKLDVVTADFVYYVDVEESDETACVVMLTRDQKLVSDNFFAANDLVGLVEKNEGLLWMSDDAKYSQRAAYVKPEKLTARVKSMLDRVDVNKLTAEEMARYHAYLDNGPVKYSKAESLMAVLSGDFDPRKLSSQLAEIDDYLQEETPAKSRRRKR